MSKSVIFLVFIILCSYSLTKKNTNYNKILDILVELNQANGGSQNDIAVLIDQVSSTMKENHINFQQNQNKLASRCETGKLYITSFLNKLKDSDTQLDIEIKNANEAITKAQDESKKYKDQIQASKEEISTQEELIKKEIDNFRISASEAEHKLSVIKVINDIVEDEILKPGTSFIQTGTKTKMQDLKTVLSGVKAKESMFSAIAITLISLAEKKGFADQAISRKILEVLGKLRDNLIAYRKRQDTDGKGIIEAMKSKAQQILNAMKQYANLVAESDSSVKGYKSIISNSEKERVHLSKILERKTNELAYWEKICESQAKLAQADNEWEESFEAKIREVISAQINK